MKNLRYIGLIQFSPTSIIAIPDADLTLEIVDAWIEAFYKKGVNQDKIAMTYNEEEVKYGVDKIIDLIINDNSRLLKL